MAFDSLFLSGSIRQLETIFLPTVNTHFTSDIIRKDYKDLRQVHKRMTSSNHF